MKISIDAPTKGTLIGKWINEMASNNYQLG